jgi:hypothetical protein
MILDAYLQFSNAQNLAQTVAAYDSTNVIDLGLSGIPASISGGGGGGARDIGIGNSDAGLRILAEVVTGFTSGGSATLSVTLEGAPDNGSGSPGSFTAWWASPVYTLAQLDQGARLFDIDMPRPPQGVAMPRFLKLVYTIAGATTTAGNISAYILGNRDDQVYNSTDNSIQGGYPAGVLVPN